MNAQGTAGREGHSTPASHGGDDGDSDEDVQSPRG